MKNNNMPATASMIAKVLPVQLEEPFVYRGLADASAAAALGPDLFVVATDENNQLRVYRRGQADPLARIDLSGFLGTKAKEESDLEGAAAIGERIYWISSHGRNKKGEAEPARHRFFATEANGGSGHLREVGSAYAALLEDMIAAPQLKDYPIAEAAARTPESQGAFNIEGLAATREGALLIGLRNPAPRGKALVVPLLNPAAVVESGEAARFGEVVELDLGGRAIRSLELVGLAYLIVAGPMADRGQFTLYQWSGHAQEAPIALLHEDFDEARPEALFAIPGTRKVQILSDDGGSAAKKQPAARQTFRSVTITL